MDASTTDKTTSKTTSSTWLELTDPADGSRLLYGCPVCFLTTVNANIASSNSDPLTPTPQPPKHNVMVISWLTPAGDDGSGLILLSMNRRRHTASVLLSTMSTNALFGLSIPTSCSPAAAREDTGNDNPDMEELLAHVGRTSGRWGRSKFPCDYIDTETTRTAAAGDENSTGGRKESGQPFKKSKRARKQEIYARGIPELRRTALGSDHYIDHQEGEEISHTLNDSDDVFAIEGTIAHLQCQVLHLEERPIIDDSHYFIVAKITKAFVQESHWDTERRVFCASSQSTDSDPKYCLTFFGSRRFGYVRPRTTQPQPVTDDETTQLPSSAKNTKVPWTVLTEGKQFSRLLYTNPLCLMSSLAYHAEKTPNNAIQQNNDQQQRPIVVSWLTATNNLGNFMFCLERTLVADMFPADEEISTDIKGKKFCLSVPVEGMEDLVQTLLAWKGKTSEPVAEQGMHVPKAEHVVSWKTISLTTADNDNRGGNNSSLESPSLQCISGCVASMECQVYDTAPTASSSCSASSTTDTMEKYVVVFAKVDRAFVHPSYWNGSQHWFVPTDNTSGDEGLLSPPLYMKYLGNDTFGYVLPSLS